MHATRVLHCFDQVLHFGLFRVVLHNGFVRLSRYFHLRFLHAFYALQCRLHCGQTVASRHPTDLQCHGLLLRWCRCSQGNQECKHRPGREVDFSLHENHTVVMQSLELLLTSTPGWGPTSFVIKDSSSAYTDALKIEFNSAPSCMQHAALERSRVPDVGYKKPSSPTTWASFSLTFPK